MSKAAKLRAMLESDKTEVILEAHDGLSARIVEEAGFDGIWASGLAISASLGVRDNNEASWTQVLDVVEFMSDATSIPILLDGDTGFGNFNNFRRLVTKLEQRSVGGVCIEDKLFPKTNSFIAGESQPLADVAEFSGKIRAGVDTRTDPDFCIVARVEGFIAGWGLEEVLHRAHRYAEAGADAVLIHSKKASSEDIDSFMDRWDGSAPVVVVPTMYPDVPLAHFQDLGVSLVIWANHLVRASVTAMQETARQIAQERSISKVDRRIAPVSEIFRLQHADELKQAEARYFGA